MILAYSLVLLLAAFSSSGTAPTATESQSTATLPPQADRDLLAADVARQSRGLQRDATDSQPTMSDALPHLWGDSAHASSGPVMVAALSIAPRVTFIRSELSNLPAPQLPGGGRNVRIQVALQQILPEGYAIDVHPRLQTLVADWSAAQTLEESLRNLRVDQGNVSIIMNTDMKVVQVVPVKEAAQLIMSAKPMQWDLRIEDGRLDKAIRRWAREAGYTFRWDADRYVLIAAPTTFTGTFESAVEQVLDTPGIKQSEYPMEACVYNNEPPLLRITRLGDQKEECK